jgi:hypothetical protein
VVWSLDYFDLFLWPDRLIVCDFVFYRVFLLVASTKHFDADYAFGYYYLPNHDRALFLYDAAFHAVVDVDDVEKRHLHFHQLFHFVHYESCPY